MTAPPLRTSLILPNCESLTHFSKLWSEVSGRVRVTSPDFQRPGSFLIMYLPSGPFCLSSMTSCSIFSPETSVMDLIVMPSTSRPKEWPTELSRSGRAISVLPFLVDGVVLGDRAGEWTGHARKVELSSTSLGDEAGATGELGQL